MKILYNDIKTQKDFKHFKEWHYLYASANILKNKNYFGKTNFIEKTLIKLIIFVFATIIWANIYRDSAKYILNETALIITIICAIYVLLFILSFVGYYINYNNFKKQIPNKKKCCVQITEEGISDRGEDITVSSKWEKVTSVLIGEYYIAITTTTNIMYLFPIEIKEKLISNINKYNTNKKLKFLEKTK